MSIYGRLLIVFCVSSTSYGALDPAKQSNVNTIKQGITFNANEGDDTVYKLDISNPSISQPIEPKTDDVERAKFVQVEVVEVVNPKKYALTFEVHYQPTSSAKIYLGSFSLYPADNPGKFIVPTQGKVKNEGAIMLSMVISNKIDPGDLVKIRVKRIRFLKG